MNATRDIVLDLLPLYAASECSSDTKKLVEEFLKSDPEMKQRLAALTSDLPGIAVPRPAAPTSEIRALKLARRKVRIRSSVMALAIFFSLAPFSVFKVGETAHFLIVDSPLEAALYGVAGILLWVVYYFMKKRSAL